ESKGLSGLVDESRRPKRSPMKTSAELALEIVQLRKEHPRWGPKKIVAIMAKRHPGMTVPSIVTVARVLRDAGLQQRVLRRQSGGLSPAPAHLIPTEPNDLWTVDSRDGGAPRMGRDATRSRCGTASVATCWLFSC